MTTETLELVRGDYKAFNLAFSQGGTPINITGFSLFFTAKEDAADSDAEAVISKKVTSHTDPTAGLTVVELDADDTDVTPGSYLYDFQLVNVAGKPTTVLMGTLNIIADITREIS